MENRLTELIEIISEGVEPINYCDEFRDDGKRAEVALTELKDIVYLMHVALKGIVDLIDRGFGWELHEGETDKMNNVRIALAKIEGK